MRLAKRFLPHPVTIEPLLEVPPSTGARYGEPRPADALVVDKVAQVADMRADSTSRGEVVQATTIAVIPFEWGVVTPGSKLTHRAGTQWERTLEIVAVAANTHPVAPSTIQLWMQ